MMFQEPILESTQSLRNNNDVILNIYYVKDTSLPVAYLHNSLNPLRLQFTVLVNTSFCFLMVIFDHV